MESPQFSRPGRGQLNRCLPGLALLDTVQKRTRGTVLKIRVIRIVLAVMLIATGGSIAAPSASAQGERRGNWNLYVDVQGCTSDSMDQAWCGPELIVQADLYLSSEDRYSAQMRLIGPNGEVPLQFGPNARFIPGRGLRSTNPNYWGPAFEKRTPTGGLTPGRYGVTLALDISGRWSCSIYSEDICRFLRPRNLTYAWIFDWDGATLEVPVVNLIREAETKVAGRASAKPTVVINAVVSPDRRGTQVTFQRQTKNGKWRTIGRARSRVLGYVTFTDRSAPKANRVRYRVFASDAPNPDFGLTVTAQTR